MDRFVDKFAVVTGVSAGIGEQIAKELLKRNVNVIGIARRTEKLQTLSEEIDSKPKVYLGKFYFFICDISKEDEIKETFSKIKSTFGQVAILINNAAVMEPFTEKISDFETQLFNKIFDTNVRGNVLCANEAVKLMADSSVGGHIVNVNSIMSLPSMAIKINPIYAASKKAMRSFADALRHEMVAQKRNIKVSVVSPGLVNTDMSEISGIPIPTNSDEVLASEDVAMGCIAVLDTPPNVVVMEYSLIAKHSVYQ